MNRQLITYKSDLPVQINPATSRFTIEGRPVIMHMADAGESFAEASLFSDVYHCNAVATVPSEINFYSGARVLEIMRENLVMVEKFIFLSYNSLRGYSSADPCSNIPTGHDPEMWRQHNNCK